MYLYEGLNKEDRSSMMLWESAGRYIAEANLNPQQITKLFRDIDQGQTAAGGNRTALGMTKDAAAKVSAAYKDLKAKALDSGPVKGIDALYDQAAAKLKQATGGDQGAMQYVQKYRDFAKKHPVAQKLIYSALIAAAGISGAGAGGAAALGLFKMVDKLLQGEKFSAAAVAGAETGLLAYGASKLGDLVKNTINPSTNTGDITWEATGEGMTSAHLKNGKVVGDILFHNQSLKPGDPGYKEAYTAIMDYAKQQGMTGAAAANVKDIANTSMDAFKSGGSMVPSTAMKSARELAQAKMAQMAQNATFESRNYTPEQVQALFEHVAIAQKLSTQLQEGIWDDIKSGTGKALGDVVGGVKNVGANIKRGATGQTAQSRDNQSGKYAKTGLGAKIGHAIGKAGHQLTTKITAERLTKAWQNAGSPTDSAVIEKILRGAGVNPEVINTVFKVNNIPTSTQAGVQQDQQQGGQQTTQQQQIKMPDVSALTPQQKQILIKNIDKLLATAQ